MWQVRKCEDGELIYDFTCQREAQLFADYLNQEMAYCYVTFFSFEPR